MVVSSSERCKEWWLSTIERGDTCKLQVPSVHHWGVTKLTIECQIARTGWDPKNKFAEFQMDSFNF